MEYKGYAARVVFDEDAGVLFGEVEGLRDVVTFEATNAKDLKAAFRQSVDDYLSMCAERGEEPEKPYSGKFLLRVDARLHREIAMAAARSGKSLNAFASEVMKNWIQRERQTMTSPRPFGRPVNARSVSETWREYPSSGAGAVLADSGKETSVYTESTHYTPGSSAPVEVLNPESVSRTPGFRTPAAKITSINDFAEGCAAGSGHDHVAQHSADRYAVEDSKAAA